MIVSDLRSRHEGGTCWVLCNGPSLKHVDLRKLKGRVTIGMNGIYAARRFKPTYHVIEDIKFAEDHAAEVNAFRGPVKVYAADLAGAITADCPVNFVREGFSEKPRFGVDAAEVMYWGGTVTYMALQLAYYLGVREARIVGADHHMVIPPDAVVRGATVTSAGDDPNHFHKGYFAAGTRWHLPDWARQERAYARAREVFEHAGRRVLNCTVGGKLEVFPRVNWREALDQNGARREAS